jgi:hypothetical protein
MPPTARKLTTHQKSVLIQVLLAFPEQNAAVRYLPSASDARDYAQDFLTIFKAVGWRVNEAESAGASQASAPAAGLAVVVSENQSLPPSAEALRDALRIYGIEMQTIGDPTANISSGSFVLSVGAEA